jgi:hypothetical protein
VEGGLREASRFLLPAMPFAVFRSSRFTECAIKFMTPFEKVPQNPAGAMIKRECLLAAPDDAYRHIFGGRSPTLNEKLHVVELAVQCMTTFDIYRNDTYL